MTHHQPEWDFYFSALNDMPASIALDLALADVAPLRDVPTMLWVSVKLNAPAENGFPTEAEAPMIAEIEDALVKQLEGTGALQVARVKTGGVQDLYFYAPTSEGFEQYVLEIMEEYPNYEYATDAEDDPEWTTYLAHLYPDEYQFHSILNRRVVDQLQKQGDKPEIPRDVDHFLYFADEAGRQNFMKVIQDKGFKILSMSRSDDDPEFPYAINIVRKDPAGWQEINDCVWELCEISEGYNGRYDSWGCEVTK